jgi:hypothetical protein
MASRAAMVAVMAWVVAPSLPGQTHTGGPASEPAKLRNEPGRTVPQQPPTARTIAAWLWCDDCGDRQLDAVVRLGQEAVGPLSQRLREIPAEDLQLLRRRSIAQWLSIRDTGVDSAAWLDRRMANYTAHFQRRAAVALARLQKWDTLQVALENSAARRYRGDVVQTLQYLVFNEQPDSLLNDDGQIHAVLTGTMDTVPGPIAGAPLRLRRCLVAMAVEDRPVSGTCDTYTAFAHTTPTNTGGQATFTGLLEGVYEIRVVEDSLPPPLDTVNWRPTSRLVRLLGTEARTTVAMVLAPARH